MSYVDKRIKATKETLMKALEGNWRTEHLATLKLSYELYMIFQQKVVECEKQIEQVLSEYSNQNDTDENKGEINLSSETNSNLHNIEKKILCRIKHQRRNRRLKIHLCLK